MIPQRKAGARRASFFQPAGLEDRPSNFFTSQEKVDNDTPSGLFSSLEDMEKGRMQKGGRDNLSQRELAIVNYLAQWAKEATNRSNMVTGKGLGRMILKIVEDARVTHEDEQMIRKTLDGQLNLWMGIITIDALVLTMILPVLMGDHLEGGHSSYSEHDLDVLHWALNILAGFTFMFTCFHIAVTTFLVACTSYLYGTEEILWFYVNFSHHISLINMGAFPITLGTVVTAVMIQIIIWGPKGGAPVLVMGICAIVGLFLFYKYVLKAKFFKLFMSKEVPWDNKSSGVSIEEKTSYMSRDNTSPTIDL